MKIVAAMIGFRVQLGAHTDEWMMGDRYGEIVSVDPDRVTVRLDKSDRKVRFAHDDIASIVGVNGASVNLDGMWPNALESLYVAIESQDAVVRKVADYAFKKARAMRAREAGRINTALAFERECDEIYESLPARSRW